MHMNKFDDAVYKRMITPQSKVAIVGETSHSNILFAREVARALPQFKALGFTHFGLEMLPIVHLPQGCNSVQTGFLPE